MIEIAAGNERNLKNIRQIGTPGDEDKIYIENSAYERIHQEEFAEKRVFVFMGHTECVDMRYSTYIEAVIPLWDIDFAQNVPVWNNHTWNGVFQEIKRTYEDSIIVGWALDLKGMQPKITPELEAVHREQFGGAHQLFFLMDTLEQEEHFYVNKNNHLYQRDGFYIYYGEQEQQKEQKEQESRPRPMKVRLDLPKEGLTPSPARKEETKGRYREMMYQQEKEKSGRNMSSYVMTAAILLLIGIIGVGVYQDRIQLSDLEKIISTMSQKLQGEDTELEDAEEILREMEETEQTQDAQAAETMQQNSSGGDSIPVENVPGGNIVGSQEDVQDQADTSDTQNVQEQEKTDAPDASDTEGQTQSASAEEALAEQNVVPEYYTVKKGDTLTGICRSIYGSNGRVKEIQEMNDLEDADNIQVGQQLRLPQ